MVNCWCFVYQTNKAKLCVSKWVVKTCKTYQSIVYLSVMPFAYTYCLWFWTGPQLNPFKWNVCVIQLLFTRYQKLNTLFIKTFVYITRVINSLTNHWFQSTKAYYHFQLPIRLNCCCFNKVPPKKIHQCEHDEVWPCSAMTGSEFHDLARVANLL